MNIFDTISNYVTGGASGVVGGAVSTIADTIKAYFPPDMSPEKKAEAQLAVMKEENAQKIGLLTLAHQMDADFNQRVKDLEGTAADLKSIPILGAIILFLRGCQRPVWGFATIYLDFMVFSKTWAVDTGTAQAAALMVINVLVLGFLFGERAIQNVMMKQQGKAAE